MKRSVYSALGLAILWACAAQGATYYVDVDWTGATNGTADAPFRTFKAAVNAANAATAPHTIHVAEGWYGDEANGGTEDYSAGGGADGGILITKRINFYGGCAGWTGDTNFNWSSRVSRTTVVDLQGASSRAFRHEAPDTGALFDGLTFRNASHGTAGGAIYSPYSYSRTMYVNDCLFSNNVTTSRGGAIDVDCTYFAGYIRNSDFLDNRANANGGAVSSSSNGGSMPVENCRFLRNRAAGDSTTGRGGALYWTGSNGPSQLVARCSFESNSAVAFGGAVFSTDPRVCFVNSTFISNSAPSGAAVGGAVYWTGTFVLQNCLVAGNLGGYAVESDGSRCFNPYTLDVLHCTIVSNTGGGLRFQHGDGNAIGRIRNSIIAFNGSYGINRPSDGYLFANNDVYANVAGNYYNCSGDTASVSLDPLFADPAVLNFRLARGSPCVDAALEVGLAYDGDGVPRPLRQGFDIGSYEEWQIPSIINRAPVADATSVLARAAFTYESTNIVTDAWFVLDTADQGTNAMGDWWQEAAAGPQTQSVIFGATFSGLSPDTLYWFRCVASNDYDVFYGPPASFRTPTVGGVVRLWTGGSTNKLASNPGNWQGGEAPGSGDYILLDTASTNLIWDAAAPRTVGRWTQTEAYTGTVTFPITYPAYSTVFTNFTIAGEAYVNGGRWTQATNPVGTAAVYRLNVEVHSTFILGPLAQVNVDAMGFQPGYGPGKGTGDNQGPSYGGQGGFKSNALPVATYGSIFQPVDLGSGGLTGGGGGPGGGAIQLTVAGEAVIDGLICARGGFRPANNDYRNGTGGSILLKASSLSGSGTVDARACLGSLANAWTGGGGGRIALILTNGASFGAVTCIARGQTSSDVVSYGAGGTIYLQAAGQAPGQGRLVVENGGVTLVMNAVTWPAEPLDLSALEKLVLTNGALLGVTTNTAVNFASARIEGGGELRIRSTNAVSFPNPFVVTNGYRLCLDVPVEAAGNWEILTNALITHSPNFYGGPNPESRISLALDGNLTIHAGGRIDAGGRGYLGNTGPGAMSLDDNRGASHGGQGGCTYTTASPTYGSILMPVTLGSGGRTGGGNGPGGGAVRLSVSGDVVLNGTVSAAGGSLSASGGSVLLQAETLSGSGAVDASGAPASSWSGGGGGRIAVHLGSGSFPGTVALRAYGGDGSGTNREGSAGTVYVRTPADPGGLIVVHNNNLMPGTVTPLPGFAGSGEELRETGWIARSRGRIGLVSNVLVKSLSLEANSLLDLKGFTGTVYFLTITNKAINGGVYTAAQLAPIVQDSAGGSGRLIVRSRGTVILVR